MRGDLESVIRSLPNREEKLRRNRESTMKLSAASWRRTAPILIGVTAARLYLFGFLYIFFLNTNLRDDQNFFIFQKEGQTRESREAEIQASFWERLAPFDGQFYIDIANNGYRTISAS